VCGGQPSPHKPRLVVSHSTCPPLSSSPHAHSFVLGTAVINTHKMRSKNPRPDPRKRRTELRSELRSVLFFVGRFFGYGGVASSFSAGAATEHPSPLRRRHRRLTVNKQPITKLRHGNVPTAELRLIAELSASYLRFSSAGNT